VVCLVGGGFVEGEGCFYRLWEDLVWVLVGGPKGKRGSASGLLIMGGVAVLGGAIRMWRGQSIKGRERSGWDRGWTKGLRYGGSRWK